MRVRTGEPDCSDIEIPEHEWKHTVYGDIEEEIPSDAPEPLGNPVTMTSYADANLHHDMLTGRSVTGILHFVNQMPFGWFAKKQQTVETAAYGSEFVAARIATDQIVDNRNSFRHLGVPIRGKTFMFGDNRSTVDSGSLPHAKLHKRHTALSFHRVREAVAAGILHFLWIPGPINPADVLSKHWASQSIE